MDIKVWLKILVGCVILIEFLKVPQRIEDFKFAKENKNKISLAVNTTFCFLSATVVTLATAIIIK